MRQQTPKSGVIAQNGIEAGHYCQLICLTCNRADGLAKFYDQEETKSTTKAEVSMHRLQSEVRYREPASISFRQGTSDVSFRSH
jgi:hypothetical protein